MVRRKGRPRRSAPAPKEGPDSVNGFTPLFFVSGSHPSVKNAAQRASLSSPFRRPCRPSDARWVPAPPVECH